MGEREEPAHEGDDDPTRFKPKRHEDEDDDPLDEALEESFPASDPPSVTPEREAPDDPAGGDRKP